MRMKKNLSLKLVSAHTRRWFLSFMLLFWTAFMVQAQSWSLQQCIDTAQVYNKSLQISRNNIAIGIQRQKEAISNLIPKVNVVGDYKYFIELPYQLMPMSTFNPMAPEGKFKEAQFGVPHNISASIQVALPLYNSQIYGGIRTSRIAAEIMELQCKKSEEQVFFEISNLYYNVQILQHQLDFMDSNIVNTSKLLANVQLLYQQMMVRKTEVNRVELQKEQLTTQRAVIANNVEQLLNALKFALGIPLSQSLQIESQIDYGKIVDFSNVPTIDFQLTAMQNQLLISELKTIRSSRLPSISLYGSYGQTGFGYDTKPNDFLKFFPSSVVGAQLSYPLFNGTVTLRKINQKKIEVQNSELQKSLVADQTNMQIDNAKNRRSVTLKTISNTKLQIGLATSVYQQTLLQQKEGTASLTDILWADNALREAQQNYLSAVVEYLKADLELRKLTGNIGLKN